MTYHPPGVRDRESIPHDCSLGTRCSVPVGRVRVRTQVQRVLKWTSRTLFSCVDIQSFNIYGSYALSHTDVFWEDAKQGKPPPGVGKPMGRLRLMDDHDHDRTLMILYATESGGAQDAANKIARRCRDLSFKCQNTNVRDYPFVRILFSLTPLEVLGRTRSHYQITEMFSQASSTKLS